MLLIADVSDEKLMCFGQDADLVGLKAHDVWALGVVLFVMATKSFPWLMARKGDKEYEAFLRRDFNAAPWNQLPADMIMVRIVSAGIG